MASQIEIINGALIRLGQAPIVSLDEDSKEAVYSKQIMDTEFAELLAEADWHCAYETAALVKLSEKPVGFKYAYQLPNDCVRPVKIELDCNPFFLNQTSYADTSSSSQSAYRIEKRKLCTDSEDVVLGYVSKIGVSEMDPTLASTFILKMASALSFSLTASTTNAQLQEQQYRAKLKTTKGKNALQMAQLHKDAEAIRVRRNR